MTQLVEIHEILSEQQNQLSVLLPVTAVEYLLDEEPVNRLRRELQDSQNRINELESALVRSEDLIRGVRLEKSMAERKAAYNKRAASVLRKELNRMWKEKA